MAAKDLLLDDDWDLLISNGDLVIGESDQQHIALVVVTAPGHWKENPFLGFNAGMYLGSNSNPAEMKVNLQEQLKSDNAILEKLLVTDNGEIFSLNAKRIVD